jgi:hypothetical protein
LPDTRSTTSVPAVRCLASPTACFLGGDRVSGSRSLSASGSMRLFGPPIARDAPCPL